MNMQSPTFFLVGLAVVLSVGCASTPPTVGDKMISQSQSTKDLGKQWQSGEDMIKRGEKLKSEGLDIIATGDQKVKEGDRLIAEGTTLKQESEMIYKSRFPGLTLDPAK
ncbi:MAG: hypothetical protein ACOH1Q_03610 [Thiobacillus sp.]